MPRVLSSNEQKLLDDIIRRRDEAKTKVDVIEQAYRQKLDDAKVTRHYGSKLKDQIKDLEKKLRDEEKEEKLSLQAAKAIKPTLDEARAKLTKLVKGVSETRAAFKAG